MARRKSERGTSQSTGSAAFGEDADGKPTGSAAFGAGGADTPLRGALLFGNDPQGNPTGSEAFGQSDSKHPLKGALLFGNDPQGNPTGADSFGQAESAVPLKGALLFGNDPQGNPTGSDTFGGSDDKLPMRGSSAFGAPQLIPERLVRDDIGYDFVGVMLQADDNGIAGIRKSPHDNVRARVLHVLERQLGCEADRLRSGMRESAIPWGRVRRDGGLDRELAYELRRWYSKAPKTVLGVGHVRDVLESMERMHSFVLKCDWDLSPVELAVYWFDELVATGVTTLHNEFRFFVFRSAENQEILAYVDTLTPRRRQQTARIRGPDGSTHATVELLRPGTGDQFDAPGQDQFKALVRDGDGNELFLLTEERATERYFRAKLTTVDTEEVIGKVEDRIKEGSIRALVELDLTVARVIAWGIAAVMADLSRLRRSGWPKAVEEEEEEVESIDVALGPRKHGVG